MRYTAGSTWVTYEVKSGSVIQPKWGTLLVHMGKTKPDPGGALSLNSTFIVASDLTLQIMTGCNNQQPCDFVIQSPD